MGCAVGKLDFVAFSSLSCEAGILQTRTLRLSRKTDSGGSVEKVAALCPLTLNQCFQGLAHRLLLAWQGMAEVRAPLSEWLMLCAGPLSRTASARPPQAWSYLPV